MGERGTAGRRGTVADAVTAADAMDGMTPLIRVATETDEPLELTMDELLAFSNDRDPATIRPLDLRAGDRAAGIRRWEVVVDGWRFEVMSEDARRARLRDRARKGGASAGSHSRVTVRAQIPGRITRLFVQAGEGVEQGAPLLGVEAMKMENEVRSPRAGTIGRVLVSAGDRVELGQELVVVE